MCVSEGCVGRIRPAVCFDLPDSVGKHVPSCSKSCGETGFQRILLALFLRSGEGPFIVSQMEAYSA